MLRHLALTLTIALVFTACADRSCPENCVRVTGSIKDSTTGVGAKNLPYEVYWVKKKTIKKFELIDTGMTDANGNIDKSFPIDKDRFVNQQIFVRVLPNDEYRQAKGTIITQAIEDYKPTVEMHFTVLQTTDLTIIVKPKPTEKYPTFLLTYNYDGNEYKAHWDSTGLNKKEHKVRTAANLWTKVSAFSETRPGVLKRREDSIKCVLGKPNTITINL